MIPASISIDMDGINCYRDIYGLPKQESFGEVLKTCVDPWLSLLSNMKIKGTFFLVGQDLQYNTGVVTEILKEGHEIANHSWSHLYDLTYCDETVIFKEIHKTDSLLRSLGVTPVGFRVPGYHLSKNVIASLKRMKYQYSSSQLPSFSYYLAKEIVKSILKLQGNSPSASQSHPFSDVFTKSFPYYPDLNFPSNQKDKPQKDDLLEIPVSTGGFPLQIPATGNFIFLLKYPALFFSMNTAPFIANFHGIDLWPDTIPIDPDIIKNERALQIGYLKRTEIVESLIKYGKKKNYFFSTLSNIATTYSMK